MQWIFHIGIAQSIFSAFILFTKRRKNQSDVVLGFWMMFIAFELVHMLLENNHSPLHGFTSNFGFYAITFGPFLFLYTQKLTRQDPSFHPVDLLHFLPYFILSLLHLIFFTNRRLESDIMIEVSNAWEFLIAARVIFLCLPMAVYSYLSYRIIIRHQKSIKDHFSFESNTITLSWLRQVILIFVGTYAILIINVLTGNITLRLFDSSHLIPAAGLTFFCFSLSYFGFDQPAMFQALVREENHKMDKTPVWETKNVELEDKLIKYLINEKPFLKPELSIQELADGMKWPRHYITDTLKNRLNKNFFTLINDYRIAEVKMYLANSEHINRPVLEIALACGFNSKSSFNAIFKEYTGLTPSEYRKQQQGLAMA
ncbi:MAG: helix-turn-helix transcriptional regulator [Cyclobacteriaceae bacterium]|nr:helix-turn-helix transcriptional regulator [Cyclobacteriaceae bacterium]